MIIMEHNERYARDFGYSLTDVCDELARHSYSPFGLRDAERGDPDDIHLYGLNELPPSDIGTLVAMPARAKTGVPPHEVALGEWFRAGRRFMPTDDC